MVEADPDTEGEGATAQVDGVGQGSIAVLTGQVKVQVIIRIQICKHKYIMFVDGIFAFYSIPGQQQADIYKEVSATIDRFSCHSTLTVETLFVSATKYIPLFNQRTKCYYLYLYLINKINQRKQMNNKTF